MHIVKNGSDYLAAEPSAPPQKYIRVRSSADARFVEFDFAIGDPSLFVELIMPPAVFESFCRNNNVIEMTDEQMQAVDAELQKWRYGEETLMANNHRHHSSSQASASDA